MTNFDADKITDKIREAEEYECSRFEGLAVYFGEGLREAIEKHNAREAEHGFPPASHYEISVSLAWAVGWHFVDDEKMDRIIAEFRYMRSFPDIDETPEELRRQKSEAHESLLRLMGCKCCKCKS